MTRPWIELRGVDVDTVDGRPLARALSLSLGDEQVALVGRNGVGKSTLLRLLAGEGGPRDGVVRRGRVLLVPQHLPEVADALSPGERRKRALALAFQEEPDVLLLDEPGEDLDEAGVVWLLGQLRRWRRGLVVVSHDRRMLAMFEHFFVMAESGCRLVSGGLSAYEALAAREEGERQAKYLEHLAVLAGKEAHDVAVRRRRRRKKARGRISELKRCTSRMRLNSKRSGAQVSQARVAGVREDRIVAVRAWARAARRALSVQLPLSVVPPTLPPDDGAALVVAEGVSLRRGARSVVDGLDLRVGRERLAVVGPNGAGKTSLLSVLLGELAPDRGRAWARLERVGVIDQGAMSWRSDETLLARLFDARGGSLERLAELLVAHRFPLALAERPMASLSPGERVRAALIVLFERRPAVELLVLDEPTAGLDAVGAAALTEALAAWPGGLIVTSHDEALLTALGVARRVRVGGEALAG